MFWCWCPIIYIILGMKQGSLKKQAQKILVVFACLFFCFVFFNQGIWGRLLRSFVLGVLYPQSVLYPQLQELQTWFYRTCPCKVLSIGFEMNGRQGWKAPSSLEYQTWWEQLKYWQWIRHEHTISTQSCMESARQGSSSKIPDPIWASKVLWVCTSLYMRLEYFWLRITCHKTIFNAL